MLEVINNRIYLTRGDSANIQLSITDSEGNAYEPTDGDRIYFRLKKSVQGNRLLLVKEISPETLILELNPNETAHLTFATYRYEVELAAANGTCFKVIANSEFVVGPELEPRNV